MKTIHIHTTFAKLAALATLAALALLAASCTDQYAPAEVSPEAMAGAPINFSVAPPPAFTEVNATAPGTTAAADELQPATRASQTDKATQWEAGDILWLRADFFEDEATAVEHHPGDVTYYSALKHTGTTWRILDQQETDELGLSAHPDFVRQLHWPKGIEGWKAPVMYPSASYIGNGKPDANGVVTITPVGEIPTTPVLQSVPIWVHPNDESIELKFYYVCSRLRIPAGYKVESESATQPFSWYREKKIMGNGITPPQYSSSISISVQEATDVFLSLYNPKVKLINTQDNTTCSLTLTPLTDEDGKDTWLGASYIFTPNSSGAEAPLTPGLYDLLISNEEELRAFAKKVNSDEKIDGLNGLVPAREAKVLQTANITLNGEWTPIGYQPSFEGSYNGNGHTIENMTITKGIQVDTREGKSILAGMFRSINNAVLTGINLRNVTLEINADNTIDEVRVGSLAGETANSTISLCSATGRVTVNGNTNGVHTGGITGYNYKSTISRCRAAVEVTATNTNAKGETNAGGIVGFNFGFILSSEAQDKTVTANSTSTTNAGGIAAVNDVNTGYIAFCRAGNAVYANNGGSVNRAGGLIGYNGGYLYASYANQNATATSSGGSNKAGVLVGDNKLPDRVQHCYGAGTASPDNSKLGADKDNIVYKQNPAPGEILTLMQRHTDAVESIPDEPDYYPTTTHYDPSASPAYGIEPIRVKWTSRAWKQGSDPKYPEIDRAYQGE